MRHAWVWAMYVLWVCSAGLAPPALMTTSPTPGGLSSAFKPMETASRCLISSLGNINSIGMCGCLCIMIKCMCVCVWWCSGVRPRGSGEFHTFDIRQWLVSVLYSWCNLCHHSRKLLIVWLSNNFTESRSGSPKPKHSLVSFKKLETANVRLI